MTETKKDTPLVEVCDYLNGKSAAVTASVDGLVYREEDAPDQWWADKKGGYYQSLLTFKNNHPKYKLTVTFTPKNRYGLEETDHKNRRGIEPLSKEYSDIRNAPESVRQWLKDIDELDWFEIADHGLTHSPDDSTDLDMMEFDPHENPHSIDPEWCRKRVADICEIYQELGLDNSKLVGFRGPGFRWTDTLLDALLEKGFRYNLVKGFLHNHYQPTLRRVGSKKTYMERFGVRPFFYETESGNKMLFIPTTIHPLDRNYPELFNYIIQKRGILNFFYHFQEPIYEQLDETVGYLENLDKDAILWWATPGEIANYWIKKESVELTRIIRNESSIRIEASAKSAINSPVSIRVGIAPQNIEEVTCNDVPVIIIPETESAVITVEMPIGETIINLRLKNSAEKTADRRELTTDPKRTFKRLNHYAFRTRLINGITFVSLFILAVTLLLQVFEPVWTTLVGVFIISMAFSLLIGVKLELFIPGISATGFTNSEKRRLYATHMMLNPFHLATRALKRLIIHPKRRRL